MKGPFSQGSNIFQCQYINPLISDRGIILVLLDIKPIISQVFFMFHNKNICIRLDFQDSISKTKAYFQYFRRMMVRHGSGLIINVSPHKQLTRMMNEISYQLEQSGYNELTLAYATALQKHNVSILSLCVGPIKGFKNLDCGNGKLVYHKSELSKNYYVY